MGHPGSDRDRLTELLAAANGGDREAFGRLYPLVHDELPG